MGINPGDLAPAFSLPDLEGAQVNLADFKGRTVLLNFWATWCVPCEAEMPLFQRLYDRLKEQNFTVVAVAVDDSLESVKEFQKRYALSFPILYDQQGITKRLYKYSGFPESFIISKEGRLSMILDPEDNQPVLRIIGPRQWDSETVWARLLALKR